MPLARSNTAPLASFFSRESELAPELVDYFGGFQQIISYLFDPDEILQQPEAGRGAKSDCGSPKITGRNTPRGNWRVRSSGLALYSGGSGGGRSCLTSRETSIALAHRDPSRQRQRNEELAAGTVRSSWRQALLRLTEDSRLLLIGGEADEERATQLARALPNERVSVRDESSAAASSPACLQNCGFFSVTTAASRISPRLWGRLPAPFRSDRSGDLGARESAGARVRVRPA